MFAILGDMPIEILEAPEELEEKEKFMYAEHKVLKGKARLQRMGEELKKISLKFTFFENAEAMIEKINELARKGEALDFVLGNGRYLGSFVIEEIKKVWKETDFEGNILRAEVEILLREYP